MGTRIFLEYDGIKPSEWVDIFEKPAKALKKFVNEFYVTGFRSVQIPSYRFDGEKYSRLFLKTIPRDEIRYAKQIDNVHFPILKKVPLNLDERIEIIQKLGKRYLITLPNGKPGENYFETREKKKSSEKENYLIDIKKFASVSLDAKFSLEELERLILYGKN